METTAAAKVVETNDENMKPKEDDEATFTQVDVDGSKKLKCKFCEKICDKEPAMKSHITKKHTNVENAKKRKSDRTDEEEEEERKRILTARMMEKYSGEGGSSQPLANIEDILNYNKKDKTAEKEVERMETVIEVAEVNENGDYQAVMKADIEDLKVENARLKAKVEEMKMEMETKQELLEAKTGRCDKLEEEKTMMTGKYNELHHVATNMLKELEEMRTSGGNDETNETKKKLKKASDEVKSAEKNLAASIKQCGEEANRRHRAEAELARNAGLVDVLSRTLTQLQEASGPSQRVAGRPAGTGVPAGRLDGRREENKEVCRDWMSEEGCPRPHCRSSHPPGRGRMADSQKAKDRGQQDCIFWLAGSCRFTEAACNKGKHSQAMFGTRPFRRRAGSAEGGRTSPGAGGARQDPGWGAWQAPAWETRQQQQDFGRTQATAPGQVATGEMAALQVQQQLQLQQQIQILQQALQQPGLLQLQQGGSFRC